MRLADYLYQIANRLHRSNDGWTRVLAGYAGFSFLMASQATIWKMHFAASTMALLARIRDKGAEPTIDEINVLDPNSAVVLPMDGYHLDDALLDSLGFRDRKGAPHTFDIAGFTHMLRRVSRAGKTDIAVPVFDRTLELSRAAARLIPGTARHILVEGNYLLLDQPGWRELAHFFATTVMITAPRPLLESRLMQRWQNLSPAQARKKCESNDLPNADLVISASIASEFTLVTGDP